MIFIYLYSLYIVLQSSLSKLPTVAVIVFLIHMGLFYDTAQIPIKVVKTTKTQFIVRQCVGVPTLIMFHNLCNLQIGLECRHNTD